MDRHLFFLAKDLKSNLLMFILRAKMAKAFQLDVRLEGVEPEVFRQLIIPADLYLIDLHKILQVGIGWLNHHLHGFEHNDTMFLPPDATNEMGTVAYTDIPVHQFLRKQGDQLVYVYNFESAWRHLITVEDILDSDQLDHPLPYCRTGAGAAPPEDIGGPVGYADMLAALASTKHPRHNMYKEYLGDITWLPDDFDPEDVNELFQEDDYGLFDLMDFFISDMDLPEDGDDDYEVDSRENLQKAIDEIITNQLRENDPPELKKNMDRLIKLGWSSDQAHKLVAQCVILELFQVFKESEEFNRDRYIRNLNALPNEPREIWS